MPLNRSLAAVTALGLALCNTAGASALPSGGPAGVERGGADMLLVSEHHRHHPRHHSSGAYAPRAGYAETDDGYGPGYAPGNGSYGITRGYDTFGYPANSPYRPYGGETAITAPPGTAAAAEQENQRRYFCNWAPERCP